MVKKDKPQKPKNDDADKLLKLASHLEEIINEFIKRHGQKH